MKRFVLFFLLLQACSGRAQNNVGLRFFGLSIHPRGEKDNAFLMPNKLDPEARFVLNIGGVAFYEAFLHKDIFSVKLVQALYADCAARTGGFTHIGLRSKIFSTGKHRLQGGIGPTLVYRRNWLELDGYVNQQRFKGAQHDRWQYLFIWYGGEFEYTYFLSPRIDASVSFVPGYPDLMNLSLGIQYKFSGGK